MAAQTTTGSAEDPRAGRRATGGGVTYERRDRTAIITIDRPHVRNAVDAAVARGIETAIDELEADDEVWSGVLVATGPVFCAGADLKAVAAGEGPSLSTERGGFGGITMRHREKPLVVAVEGPALAGGVEIVLACDLVVAARTATFSIPEVKRSLLAGGGGLFRLPRRVPYNVALEMAITGEPISAERAAHLGFVNHLVEPGRALEGALALADSINANAPLAVRASRRVIMRNTFTDDDAALQDSVAEFERLASTADFAEGPRAFLEKRPPRWSGR